tara:strand:- start:10152 stop:11429 length:1278 start_codon:yes stop_codon:yes gene_type:complete
MNQVSLDSAEMKNFLQHIIENNRYIQKDGKRPVATEIIGESGLGKTSVALQIAEEHELSLVKLNLAQIEELGDLVGFPVRQFQMCKEGKGTTEKTVMKKIKLPNGKEVLKKVTENIEAESECLWIDENAIDQYSKQGYIFTGNKQMSYCPPEWIANKEGGGILILDDWNRADIRFIQAVMELVDRQEYISWKLPKDWHILLTANPDDGEYLVNTIDVAQRTRFVSVVMKWNHERWAEWAEKVNIDGRCINFVLMHPEIVNARVNPRSITTFFNCISSFKKFEDSLPMIQMIGEGSVGGEVATLFTTFINNRLDKLISPKEILLGKDDKTVRDALMSAICNGGHASDYRADIASILTTRFINYTILYSQKNPISPEIIQRITYLVKDPDVFTDDLKYHIVKKILNGNKQKFQKMLFDSKIQELATK